MSHLPSAAELAGPITDLFNADTAHTTQFDRTPLVRFNAGGVKNEADKAFAKAQHDGFTGSRADFDAWCASPVLRWAQAPGRVSKDGEPFKAFQAWLAAWPRAVVTMETLSRSNVINGKPNPYFGKFESTYAIHDALILGNH